MTKERLIYILKNLVKYNDCITRPLKNVWDFNERQRKYNWIVLDNYMEKKDQVLAVLQKLGFQEGRREGEIQYYWRYFKHLNLTVRFGIGEIYDNYYDCISCYATYNIIEGKVKQRSPRPGDVFYENGIMKVMTKNGVWTGD